MNQKSEFIKNVVIIAFILTVVFSSQQPYFKKVGRSLYPQVNKYWVEAKNWFKINIYPRVSGEVSKIQNSSAKEITKQKNYFFQNVWERLKSYFAGKFSDISGTERK